MLVEDVPEADDDSVASGVVDVLVPSELLWLSLDVGADWLDVKLADDSVGTGPVVDSVMASLVEEEDSVTTSLDVDPVSDSLAL